jgi:hypothetical protein
MVRISQREIDPPVAVESIEAKKSFMRLLAKILPPRRPRTDGRQG